MNLRTVAFLNWVIGCMALLAVAVYPVYQGYKVSKAKDAAVRVVDEIVRGERRHFSVTGSKFLYFRSNQADVLGQSLGVSLDTTHSGEFTFDTYRDRDYVLVVRAITSEAALRARRLPPLLYILGVRDGDQLSDGDGRTRGQWAPLSQRQAGIMGILGL